MVQVGYDLAAFTRDLDRLVLRDQDPRAIVRAGAPLLTSLLADVSWLPASYTTPVRGASAQYLLHKHPADAYSITATVFDTGYTTTVHDHTTWGLIGVWRGEEQEERFVRFDDRSISERASLRPAGEVLNCPGSVTWLIPPNEDVHRIRNLSPFPSCSIHVYGGDLDGKLRHQFDLETGAIRDFRVVVRVPEAPGDTGSA